jgi:electron transfer flavoprotein beta subunit
VVDVELNIHVQDGAIVDQGLQYVINAWDEAAVETCVQLKENHGAETTLVSIGGGDNKDIIRRCYAMGMENAVHINDPALERADSSIIDSAICARILQKFYQAGDFDLVITGKQAQDTDNGQTGIILAEYLGLPCVSNVIGIEVLDESRLKVSRAGYAGTEIVEIELPAVLTVDVSINEPRLPSMRGIMMAKKKSIDERDLAALGTSHDEIGVSAPKAEVTEFMAPKKRQGGQKFEGEPAEVTAKVVDLLANEAKVL